MNKRFLVVLILLAIAAGMAANYFLKTDFETLEGKAHQWRDFQGQWVVVNYFAPWCAPCLREIPELNHFQQNNSTVRLFALSFDNLDQIKLSELKDTYDIQFPILTKVTSVPWFTLPNSLPHTIIINPKGEVVKELKGEQSEASLLAVIKQLNSD